MWAGIDQSKRSTGVVILNDAGDLENFQIISPPKSLDDDEILEYQRVKLHDFLVATAGTLSNYSGVVVEGLSMRAPGSSLLYLAGLQACLVNVIRAQGTFVGRVPVKSWRCKVLTSAEEKEAKAFHSKDGIKIFTVNKLPENVKSSFVDYLAHYKLPDKSLWDLTDAYFLARYIKGKSKAAT